MQDLLSSLGTPVIVGLIVLVALALGIVVWLARRRRTSQEPPAEPSVSLGGPVDYTSLPLDEEPSGWRERFARLSLPGKILAFLVPLLAILGVALILAFLPSGAPTAPLPTLVPIAITVNDAAVVRAQPLTIDIAAETTGLRDGTQVTVELLEDGQPFPYLNPDQARGTVRGGRVEIQARPIEGAPVPVQGRSYTVVMRGPENSVSAEVPLDVPTVNRIAETFFGQAAAAPSPTTAPTAAATSPAAPSAVPASPTPEPTAVAQLPTGPSVAVTNGGNVRQLPIITADNVVGGVNVGEQVQLLGRTPNGQWYRVRTVRDELGWVSVTLIDAPADTSVPVAPIVTVFTNGALYERPDSASTELDRVNLDEVVLLNQKTVDGAWYFVNNVRNIAGWVPASLLGVPDEVAQAVPVAP